LTEPVHPIKTTPSIADHPGTLFRTEITVCGLGSRSVETPGCPTQSLVMEFNRVEGIAEGG
jgi:hypothetical protein